MVCGSCGVSELWGWISIRDGSGRNIQGKRGELAEAGRVVAAKDGVLRNSCGCGR